MMSKSFLHWSIAFLRIFFVLCILKEGSISGNTIYNAVSVSPMGSVSQNQRIACKESTISITSRTYPYTNSQRNSSYPILFYSSQEHLRLLHDQSKLAFTNTVRLQLHATSKVFGHIRERSSLIASSPSFPHFVAGIAAGTL